jgi:hypothetical protein
MSSCGRLLLLCVALGVSLGSAHSIDSQVERGKSRHVQCKSPCPLYPPKADIRRRWRHVRYSAWRPP